MNRWDILNAYFIANPYAISNHHLDSYEDFIKHQIPKIIQSFNPRSVYLDNKKIDIYIGGEQGNKVYIGNPVIEDENSTRVLLPNEARLKDYDYSAYMYVDVVAYMNADKNTQTFQKNGFHNTNDNIFEWIDNKTVKKTLKNVHIGSIPIMTHSKFCPMYNLSSKQLDNLGENSVDSGGFFIIDGVEKVIISQENKAFNKVFVAEDRSANNVWYQANITSVNENVDIFPKLLTLRLYKDEGTRPLAITASIKGGETTNKPGSESSIASEEFPLFFIFRALGVESDYDIIRHIQPDLDDKDIMRLLQASIYDGNMLYTQKQVIEYLKPFTRFGTENEVYLTFVAHFIPNVGLSFKEKALFLGYMTKRLLHVALGRTKPVPMDNYMQKRVEISGSWLGLRFRDFYNNLRNNIDKQVRNIGKTLLTNYNTLDLDVLLSDRFKSLIFDPQFITQKFHDVMKGTYTYSGVNVGTVQDVERLSFMSYLSNVRHIRNPFDEEKKDKEPRRLQPSQYGMCCPLQTPDGAKIGLKKHMCVQTYITFESDAHVNSETSTMITCLYDLGLISLQLLTPESLETLDKVFLNSTLIGATQNIDYMYKALTLYKRNALISPLTGIAWRKIEKELYVMTEAGRSSRPFLVCKNGTPVIFENTWQKYLQKSSEKEKWWWMVLGANRSLDALSFQQKGYYRSETQKHTLKSLEYTSAPIEYLDIEELNTYYVAIEPHEVTKEHTHMEIHPTMIFSYFMNTVPFLNKTHAPRLMYSGKIGSQAIGIYSTNYINRFDTHAYILHNPQKPLVSTKFGDVTFRDALPNGINTVVAVMPWNGYNQEDGIIINKDAIDRGMFSITDYNSISDNESFDTHSEIYFGNPKKEKENGYPIHMKTRNWDSIDDNGYPIQETQIDGNSDALIGKIQKDYIYNDDTNDTVYSMREESVQYKDMTKTGNISVSGTVDSVVSFYTKQRNERKVKVRLREYRHPEIGDKFSSLYAQKGVIGMIMNSENMPRTEDGLVPDMIINSSAFPSRMTPGQFYESIFSKLASMGGSRIDGTAYDHQDFSSSISELEKYGFDRYGDEIMYDGCTGEMIETPVFIGINYYQRLKHLVSGKFQYRTSSGPYNYITHQPASGRAIEGGVKLGEQERDVFLASGISRNIQEDFVDKSDPSYMYIETDTGNTAVANPYRNYYRKYPNESVHELVPDFKPVKVPRAFRVFQSELEAQGIFMQFDFQQKGDNVAENQERIIDDVLETEENEFESSEEETRPSVGFA